MFPGILKKLKDCIKNNRYIVTLHADEEMDDDDLSIYDVESAVLNGVLIERQQDKSPKEWKYILRGQAIDGSFIIVVAKIGATGKLVVITVFRDE